MSNVNVENNGKNVFIASLTAVAGAGATCFTGKLIGKISDIPFCKSLCDLRTYNDQNDGCLTKKIETVFNSSDAKKDGWKILNCNDEIPRTLFERSLGKNFLKDLPFKSIEEYERFIKNNADIVKYIPKEIDAEIRTVLQNTSNVQLKQTAKTITTNQFKNFLYENSSYAKGINNCAIPAEKQIVTNMKKSPFLIPHELGHAKINSTGFSTKMLIPFEELKRLRKKILLPLTALVAFNPSTKGKNNEDMTITDKVVKYSPYIAAGLYIPELVDEAGASIIGLNLAKKSFIPKETKLLKKNYKFAFLTYLVPALTSVGTIFAAKTIKEKMEAA